VQYVPLRVGYKTFLHEEQELRAKQSLHGDWGHPGPAQVSTQDMVIFFSLGTMKDNAQRAYLDFDSVI
jgi:hypothetical protein